MGIKIFSNIEDKIKVALIKKSIKTADEKIDIDERDSLTKKIYYIVADSYNKLPESFTNVVPFKKFLSMFFTISSLSTGNAILGITMGAVLKYATDRARDEINDDGSVRIRKVSKNKMQKMGLFGDKEETFPRYDINLEEFPTITDEQLVLLIRRCEWKENKLATVNGHTKKLLVLKVKSLVPEEEPYITYEILLDDNELILVSGDLIKTGEY